VRSEEKLEGIQTRTNRVLQGKKTVQGEKKAECAGKGKHSTPAGGKRLACFVQKPGKKGGLKGELGRSGGTGRQNWMKGRIDDRRRCEGGVGASCVENQVVKGKVLKKGPRKNRGGVMRGTMYGYASALTSDSETTGVA